MLKINIKCSNNFAGGVPDLVFGVDRPTKVSETLVRCQEQNMNPYIHPDETVTLTFFECTHTGSIGNLDESGTGSVRDPVSTFLSQMLDLLNK